MTMPTLLAPRNQARQSVPAPSSTPHLERDLEPILQTVLARIQPLWPLKSFVAVNPFVGLVDQPFDQACALLQRVHGAAPLQSPQDYLAAYRAGTITPKDLAAATSFKWSADALVAALENAHVTPPGQPIATVADRLDQERSDSHWSRFIVDEISKWCAITYDDNQTTWNSPWKARGLFATWREAAVDDHNPEAFGLTGFRAFAAKLPQEPDLCIRFCLQTLPPLKTCLTEFLHRQLITVAGWAGYIQYQVREDTLRGRNNPALRELLAIRLAYDAALFHAFGSHALFAANGAACPGKVQESDTLEALTRWQLAYEAGYQRRLARTLAAQPPARNLGRPTAQAIFCIDVRSEVFRRHLEAALPGIQTIGFAGFFGFPVAHRPQAGPAGARCPVLLVPPVETCEPRTDDEAARDLADRVEVGAWRAFQNSAASCFSFVESTGLAFGAALGRSRKFSRPTCTPAAPDFAGASIDARVGFAEGALRNMSLTENFARLVLICGHGSQSANNPYASALDCGACGGHAGDVNARLAAATLNDPTVRSRLAAKNIPIPDDTLFVAGLHNTATDDITLFDPSLYPASHAEDLAQLHAALATATAATRQERAKTLGLGSAPSKQLAASLRARADDIAEVRPEWGLANNAALIAAPRSRTAALRLDGRVFLHDYNASQDPSNQVLSLILCAPVVVASWINLQYYACRVDPVRYGSGNKVLHNVVGGIGVLEGNGGDLKLGLPLQSIHDGKRFMHEPRRLTVYIEAACERIDAVLAAHPGVAQLFDNGWIHLVALQGQGAHRYTPDGWQPI